MPVGIGPYYTIEDAHAVSPRFRAASPFIVRGQSSGYSYKQYAKPPSTSDIWIDWVCLRSRDSNSDLITFWEDFRDLESDVFQRKNYDMLQKREAEAAQHETLRHAVRNWIPTFQHLQNIVGLASDETIGQIEHVIQDAKKLCDAMPDNIEHDLPIENDYHDRFDAMRNAVIATGIRTENMESRLSESNRHVQALTQVVETMQSKIDKIFGGSEAQNVPSYSVTG